MIDVDLTPEGAWRAFLAQADLPRLDLRRPPARTVVVAPHPDDEVLGVGGLVALLAAVGSAVEVLAVTDGEASNPGGSIRPDVLAVMRIAETRDALDRLGPGIGVAHLHLPDGGADALEQPVVEALQLGADDWLLGPWALDGHPDHEAVGRACATAASRAGARLLAYPVWAWEWTRPGVDGLPWARALQVDLPTRVQAAKARAVAQFVSQTRPLGPLPQDAPVLPDHVLAHFERPFEVVFA